MDSRERATEQLKQRIDKRTSEIDENWARMTKQEREVASAKHLQEMQRLWRMQDRDDNVRQKKVARERWNHEAAKRQQHAREQLIMGAIWASIILFGGGGLFIFIRLW